MAYNSIEDLQRGKISFASEFPPIGFGAEKDEAFYAMLHYQAARGDYLVPKENILDDNFPNIQLITARQIMEEAWNGK